jgi:DNA polymerase-3 subunit delta'
MTAWENMIGHQWAIEHLQASIAHGRVGHAYLFTGPHQVGKATMARTFAQALNCEEIPAERPCGRCRPCMLIAASRHPDVLEISGELSARGKRTIKIDQIREVQQALSLTATEARHKVSLLKDFDTANTSAANAFLKTLEEPPSSVILMLTSVDADSLPQTIVSRCRSIALRPVQVSLIARALQERSNVDEADAEFLAQLSDGRPGWAIQAQYDQSILQLREERITRLYEVLHLSRADRFRLAIDLSTEPAQLPLLLQTWLTCWRDLAMIAHDDASKASITNIDHYDEFNAWIDDWQTAQIVRSLRTTEDSVWQLEHNANARLVIENLFLTYPAAPALNA